MIIQNPTNIKWISMDNQIDIDFSENHIINVSVDRYFQRIRDKYEKILSEAELIKSLRYVRNSDRESYIVRKHLLKILLGKKNCCDPSKIKFNVSANKKPITEGIEFNLSHSGNCVMIAFSPSPVGVDVEHINRGFDFKMLVNEYFNVNEISFINSSKDECLNFYALWTRKEALLKATGEGLIDQIDQVICLPNLVTRLGKQYKLNTFIVEETYISTLATSNESPYHYWDCTFY